MVVATAWFAIAAWAGDIDQPKLVVHVVDYANLSAATLQGAGVQAELLFHEAGVDSDWPVCSIAQQTAPCHTPVGESDLFVRILAASPSAGNNLGKAYWPEGGKTGVYASVYYNQVRDAVRRGFGYPNQLLAVIMAHEAAHLLGLEHAARGIMHSRLSGAELRDAGTSHLLFSKAQSAFLRASVAAHLAAHTAKGSGVRVTADVRPVK